MSFKDEVNAVRQQAQAQQQNDYAEENEFVYGLVFTNYYEGIKERIKRYFDKNPDSNRFYTEYGFKTAGILLGHVVDRDLFRELMDIPRDKRIWGLEVTGYDAGDPIELNDFYEIETRGKKVTVSFTALGKRFYDDLKAAASKDGIIIHEPMVNYSVVYRTLISLKEKTDVQKHKIGETFSAHEAKNTYDLKCEVTIGIEYKL